MSITNEFPDKTGSDDRADIGNLRQSSQVPIYSKPELVFYGIICLALTCFFSVLSYSTIYSYPWQSHWGTTSGVIGSSKTAGKVFRVAYSYQVGDRTMVGQETFHLHGWLVHPGDKVVVRYNPETPAISVIQTGLTFATVIWGSCAVFAFMFSIAMFASQPGRIG